MSNSTLSISVSGLKKAYAGRPVLENLNFAVPKGSIYTLLGSNGAGKTTTIRILTTQIPADQGEAEIEGYSVSKSPHKVREVISLTGQFSAVDEALTGKENLVLMARLRRLPSPKKAALDLLEYFGLADAADQRVSSYSGGMKRKLDIAMSLTGHPKVIFLDEPTTGLDPQSRRSMWKLIKELQASGVTIFLTTQYLEEAEELADRIAILDKGKIIAEGTSYDLEILDPIVDQSGVRGEDPHKQSRQKCGPDEEGQGNRQRASQNDPQDPLYRISVSFSPVLGGKHTGTYGHSRQKQVIHKSDLTCQGYC